MIIKLSSVTFYLFHGRIFESSLKLTIFGQIGLPEGRPVEVKLDESGRPMYETGRFKRAYRPPWSASKGLAVYGLLSKELKVDGVPKWTVPKSEREQSYGLKLIF